MSTLNRYLLRVFASHFFAVLGVLFILYGLVDFLEKVDDFVEHSAGLSDYLLYPMYNLPAMIAQILPMTALLATFSTINLLARTHQLTALSSCGLSLGTVTRPIFACGGLLCCVAFVMSNWLTPWASQKADYILTKEVRGQNVVKQRKKNIYLRDGERIITIARSDPKTGRILKLAVFERTPEHMLKKRVDAATAEYRDDRNWLLRDVVVREFSAAGDLTGFVRHKELLFDLRRRPQELVELSYQPEQMNSSELQRLIVKMRSEGRDPLPYRAELHFRQAQALTPLLMILLGVPFALQHGRKHNLGAGVALSLVTFVVYYSLQAVAMAFGTAGWLPLPLAAWSANLLLLLVGSWLFLTMER